jgi:hypothetical protein
VCIDLDILPHRPKIPWNYYYYIGDGFTSASTCHSSGTPSDSSGLSAATPPRKRTYRPMRRSGSGKTTRIRP